MITSFDSSSSSIDFKRRALGGVDFLSNLFSQPNLFLFLFDWAPTVRSPGFNTQPVRWQGQAPIDLAKYLLCPAIVNTPHSNARYRLEWPALGLHNHCHRLAGHSLWLQVASSRALSRLCPDPPSFACSRFVFRVRASVFMMIPHTIGRRLSLEPSAFFLLLLLFLFPFPANISLWHNRSTPDQEASIAVSRWNPVTTVFCRPGAFVFPLRITAIRWRSSVEFTWADCQLLSRFRFFFKFFVIQFKSWRSDRTMCNHSIAAFIVSIGTTSLLQSQLDPCLAGSIDRSDQVWGSKHWKGYDQRMACAVATRVCVAWSRSVVVRLSSLVRTKQPMTRSHSDPLIGNRLIRLANQNDHIPPPSHTHSATWFGFECTFFLCIRRLLFPMFGARRG